MLGALLDDDAKRFVDAYVDSLVSWAIIVFYHENPGARDRAEDLALHLGRRLDDVSKAAEKLAEKRLLARSVRDSDVVYVYHPDDRLAEEVSKFVQALDDRELRLTILSRVLEKVT
ncbi:MAG: hypothetical protein M1335_05000 [Chloroflexi bacterium]|nr:hypothetical protein [Chloroflexota bacterium]